VAVWILYDTFIWEIFSLIIMEYDFRKLGGLKTRIVRDYFQLLNGNPNAIFFEA
jgi:hypothetical protein